MAHLTADFGEMRLRKTAFSAKWPPHTRAEGGQVGPVLGGDVVTPTCFSGLGSFSKLIYSLRSSSSGVGLWKNAIHGFIMSSGM